MRWLADRRGFVAAVLGAAIASLLGCAEEPRTHSRPLRIGLHAAPLGLDPHISSDFHTLAVLANAFEGLTQLSPALEAEPALAVRWESPDELTWRFQLRDGVRFHGGRPLTSEDVVFSLERARSHPESDCASYLVAVRSVAARGPHAVEITTSRPAMMLLNKLSNVMIVPADSPTRIERPVGTGPYELRPWAGEGPLELEAFDGYWGAPPHERTVELIPPAATGDSDLDLAVAGVDILQVVDVEQLGAIEAQGYKVISQPGLACFYLVPRIDRPPFDDIRLRRALHLALDRELLVARSLAGQGAPAGQFVSQNVFGFDPDLPTPARDVERARRLISRAGHGDGLAVDLVHRSGLPVAEIRRQLAEASILVNAEALLWDEVAGRLAARKPALYLGALVCNAGADASEVFDSALHTTDARAGYGDSNQNGFSSRELDRLIETAASTHDLRQRQKLLQRCARLALDELPLIPLYVANDLYAIRPGTDWRPRLDGRVYAKDARRLRRAP